MPAAPTIPRDPALEAHVFWYRFRNEIFVAIVVALVAIVGFAGYRFYSQHRETAAAEMLGSAKKAQDYQEVIARYGNTSAGASAHLLLGQAQRNEGKFSESNATLQLFVDSNPKHELVPTARMAIAANLESMNKVDEALATYQRVAADYPKNYNAPLALISQVAIFKAKNQNDAARRACETILTQYRDSIWASEAMRELRSLKPASPPAAVQNSGNVPPMLTRPEPRPAATAPVTTPPKPKP
ncbi:MAG: hypothetical protein QOH39_2231 [Verrucomicrobiota bacterium]|jgi:TolA-binding protein